ncbi:unnamed protein product [Caenorhabditis angaria]|uniref:E3 UFM1-protein ligase 1 homolog n=1 Tax=Caenorhabditis angaria TaxID=860376 RepID=A0A9P1IT89_9PELO|nr:unnamed protein product [Caenorhabditis angaria]
MTSWADIQKLAGDLQRVQLSQSSKKLSEANCVEVISRLIQNSLIDVVYTRDGQSYVTKRHLETEVKNECIAAGGRAPLTEIATSLNIDFDHIERTARIIIQDPDFTLSNAELFSTEYVHRLRNELRELLDENGFQTTASLCKHWDLSPELLQSLLLDQIRQDFQGVLDGDTIYTNSYLESRKLILRAVIVAITKVTPISNIQKRVGLTHKRFWVAFDELLTAGEIPGHLVGSRTSPACVYTPGMYEVLVKSCVLGQMRQDEYLQISTLKKLGIDGKPALEQLIGKSEVSKLISLPTIYLSSSLLETCKTAILEEVEKTGIAEIRQALQSLGIPLDNSDEDAIGEQISGKNLNFSEGFVFENQILQEAIKAISGEIEKKAHEEVDRLEKEKKGGKKEIKGEDDWGEKKGGKKGKAGGKAAKGTPPPSSSATISEEELEKWLQNAKIVPEEILSVVVEKISQEANLELKKKINEVIASQLTLNAATAKKSLTAMAEKVKQLYETFCTFETATTSFADPLATELRQYLLKTLGLEISNAILSYSTGIDNAHQLKEKQRDETIDSLPKMLKEPIAALFASLKSDSLETFHDSIYDATSPSATSISLKKADKKSRIENGAKICADLREQLEAQNEPATALLLSVLYLLAKSGRPTSASGKFVSQLIRELGESCSQEIVDLLQSCQKGVVTCIKNKDDDVSKEMLAEDLQKLKNLILA